jgi:tetratricopeptide (TPR) repeat protein
MEPGRRVGARFSIERLAGVGGMGSVYRALDLLSGEPVALKILTKVSDDELLRFSREARVLADIDHPAVVRYVASGSTEEGQPYLAMEWVEGEDLAVRLARAGMTITESMALAERLAGALSAVHSRGVVHRDIKPQNLLLEDGDPARVKLLDFGIAHLGGATHPATRTGVGLGTPGYMAPEQARGARDVDERADVFSLGCVLFECLTGRPAFKGEHVMAVLAKVLFDEAPRLRELRPGAPAPLEALVDRMLQKEPGERPRSAAEVAETLEALRSLDLADDGWRPDPQEVASTVAPLPSVARLTEAELRLVSVLLVGSGQPVSLRAPSGTMPAGPAPPPAVAGLPGIAPISATIHDEEGALRAAVALHGGRCDKLADGTWAVTLAGSGAATDQAARAARCALALRATLPGKVVALATGRGRVGGRRQVGDVIDRAARLLQLDDAPALSDPRPSGPAREPPVRIDELTAALLPPRFHVEARQNALLLRSESEPAGEVRTLLGRRTPFVGRDRELRALTDVFEECVSEPMAQAVLLTGNAGVGKSRLRHELVERLREARAADASAGADAADPAGGAGGLEVWLARADPMRAGAPLGLLGQVIRTAARIGEGGREPLGERRKKLRARAARHVDPAIAGRVAEFLGEMTGTPMPDDESVQLRAARKDPMLMSDQMRRAWVDFIEAECQAQPVLLLLEDLQWSDAPTLEYVDAALRLLRARPLMVLALARPEVEDIFPKLWATRGVTKMRLGELSKKACDKLVREVLGAGATEAAAARLYERSEGNAFFLEELMRAVAERRGEELPSSVAAMMQSRLEALDPEARRVLRAGSVFGQVFRRGALPALCGQEPRAIAQTLAELERRELLVRRGDGPSEDEAELAFRHALVRDAAYAMLTDEDRALGHRLAAEWLTRAGERDAAVVAEHLDRGGDLARAAGFYRRAAEQALEGNDLAAVIKRVERAVTCGASGEALGELSLIRARAHAWRGEFEEAGRWSLGALSALAEGSDKWFEAVEEATASAAMLGNVDRFRSLSDALLAAWSEDRVSRAPVITAVHVAVNWLGLGQYDQCDALFARLDAVAGRFDDDPAVRAHFLFGRAFIALYRGDLSGTRDGFEGAAAAFEEAGDVRQALLNRLNAMVSSDELGAYEEAVTQLRSALADATRLGIDHVVTAVKVNLGMALGHLGAVDEACSMIWGALEAAVAGHDGRAEGTARRVLGSLLARRGDLEEAAKEATLAVEALSVSPPLRPSALATLAEVELARGRVGEAVAAAREAMEAMEALGRVEEGEAAVRLAFAEALFAAGDEEEAREAIRAARERLLERAARIADAGWRKRFLEGVHENARTLALAGAWLGEAVSATEGNEGAS